MITLHTWTTPNGRKASILLEELGVPYSVRPIDLGKNEQLSPEFLAVSPNNKIPAIVDTDAEGGPLSIFESGAILTYLADKHGRFLAPKGHARAKTLEWLFWQVGGVGPAFGQLGYFATYASEKLPAAIERFTTESQRLLGVMDKQLASHPYLAGAEFTIADIATYPWILGAQEHFAAQLGGAIAGKKNVAAWLERVGARPGVQRGMRIPEIAKDR